MKLISKILILSAPSFFLFSTHVNAQGSITQINSPNVSTNTTISTTVNDKSYHYTVNDVKNSVNITYGDKTQEVQDDAPFKGKSFTKSFSLDKNDKINLSNQYGSITIKTWDKNEIRVDVDLKAYAKTESEAQKLLDNVSINATKAGDLVSYKTEMGSRNGNWGSNVRNGKTIWRREVKVNYIVYMPNDNALTASQQYGNIIMGDFSGPTSIKLQYGNLTAGNLTNTNNYLSIQYGKGDIKDMGGADIKHQYGNGLTIGTISNTLNLNAQYTAVKIAAVKGAASIKHQYGSGTTIGSVSGSLNVNTQYCAIRIGTLRGNLTSKAQYGKVIIEGIDADKDVDIEAQYTDVNLGFATNYNADFNVSTNYGSFKYGPSITTKRIGDDERSYSSSKKYTGQISKGGSNRINVKSQYSDIVFK